jgi:hypothetical protein
MCSAADVSGAPRTRPTIPKMQPNPIVTIRTTSGLSHLGPEGDRLHDVLEQSVREAQVAQPHWRREDARECRRVDLHDGRLFGSGRNDVRVAVSQPLKEPRHGRVILLREPEPQSARRFAEAASDAGVPVWAPEE